MGGLIIFLNVISVSVFLSGEAKRVAAKVLDPDGSRQVELAKSRRMSLFLDRFAGTEQHFGRNVIERGKTRNLTDLAKYVTGKVPFKGAASSYEPADSTVEGQVASSPPEDKKIENEEDNLRPFQWDGKT